MKQLISVIYVLFALSAQAQEAPRFRHMLSLGIGTTTIYDIHFGDEPDYLVGDYWYPPYYGADTYHSSQSYIDDTYHPALVDVSYHYQSSKHWSHGFTLGLHTRYQKERSVSSKKAINQERETNLSAIASARYYWRTKEWVRTYSELGMGITRRWEKERYDDSYSGSLLLTAHITALGIEVGNGPLIGYGEIGLGVFGCLRAGIGYRF